jgi:hypothetical protein
MIAWMVTSRSSSSVIAAISSPANASRREVKRASDNSASFLSLVADRADAGPTAERERMLMAVIAAVRRGTEVWVRKVLVMSSQSASYAYLISFYNRVQPKVTAS